MRGRCAHADPIVTTTPQQPTRRHVFVPPRASPRRRLMPRNLSPKVRIAVAAGLATLILSALTSLTPVTQRAASAQSGESLFVRKIGLKANDIVYSPATNMLYASVPSNAGSGGNTITPISPSTGEVGTPVFIGSEPNKLAISDDGNTVYATLEGAF